MGNLKKVLTIKNCKLHSEKDYGCSNHKHKDPYYAKNKIIIV